MKTMNKRPIDFIPFVIGALIICFCGIARADIVSLESNYVAGQTDVVGKLNRDRLKLTNGVNNIQGAETGTVQTAGQIKAGTVGNENMASSASPRVYLNELFIQNMDDNNGLVASGLEFVTSGTLATSATPGVAYTNGYRIEKASSTPHTFNSSKWTYAFVCQDGSLSYVERNIGVDITTSEYPANCQPISRVSSDSTTVNAVKDLRKLKFTFESYDSVYDSGTESSLKNLLTGNGNSYRTGAMLQYSDASRFTVTAGAAMINGKARDRVSYTSDASWPVSSTSESDGLDSGTRGNGKYYVYLVSDASSQREYTVVHSLSDSAPSGKTNYLKIGEFYTNTGTISSDSVISYLNGSNVLPGSSQLVKGWVNFNGTGTVAINDSYNVSSIVDDGVGLYTIVWDEDFGSADYALSGSAQVDSGGSEGNGSTVVNLRRVSGALSTGSAKIVCISLTGTPTDSPIITLLATGDR